MDDPLLSTAVPVPLPPAFTQSQSEPSKLAELPAIPPSISADEIYEMQVADHTIYNLMRTFASATRALAMYDCRACLLELEKLPREHQRSAWVMSMVGKAHYELGEYAAVCTSVS
jgi:anaphase-promoting complex subunit 3